MVQPGTCRVAVIEAMGLLKRRHTREVFALEEIVQEVESNWSRWKTSTIRTHVSSHMVRGVSSYGWADLDRFDRGQYGLSVPATVPTRTGGPAARVNLATAPATRPSGQRSQSVIQDGAALLDEMLASAGYRCVEEAVAAHTIFLDPATVEQAAGKAIFPVVRDPQRRDEIAHLAPHGRVLYDDNTTPTLVFLWAAQRKRGPDVQFNHVWATSKDPDSYTALWNLCCTPAFLAKTTDTHPGVGEVLRFRSWDLYAMKPAREEIPEKPTGYDDPVWAESPAAVPDLESLFRGRLRSSPKSRPARAAREIGWAFSDGPDPEI